MTSEIEWHFLVLSSTILECLFTLYSFPQCEGAITFFPERPGLPNEESAQMRSSPTFGVHIWRPSVSTLKQR
jgi:hypothetical protein